MTNTSVEWEEESAIDRLNLPYAICEALVALVAVIGNAMVIHVFRSERRLRRRTNYYIVSLATADFLVGLLGIPFALMASVGLPTNLHACLFTVSLLVVLCTISIFCLVAVSVDRYWAILHPMGYSKNVRTKTAIVIISVCWAAGTLVGFLPLFGWNKGESNHIKCFFVEVMDYNYLVFLYFATIITPSLLLAGFYAHIYHVVLKQLRQIVTVNASGGGRGYSLRAGGGTMLRVLGAAQKREVKATQNLAIIVLFFVVCWIPLYTINCIKAFCPDCYIDITLTNCCIILSHLNSAGNPILYAYHLRDFRAALKQFLYRMLGMREPPTPNVLDNHASSNFNHQRLQSLRDLRDLRERQRSIYTQSPLTRNRISLISHHAQGNILSSSQTAPNLTTTLIRAENNGNAREMWKIAEASSGAEEASKEYTKSEGKVISAHSLTNMVSRANKTSDSSGKNNEAYIDEGFVMDFNDDDDDVFLSDSPQNSSTETPVESKNIYMEHLCDPSIINVNNIPDLEITVTPDNECSSESKEANSISRSSLHLSRALFIVESEVNSNISDISANTVYKLEDSQEKIVGKELKLSASCEFLNNSSKNTRFSPLKKVGDFLIQHAISSRRSKSNNKLDFTNTKDIDLQKSPVNLLHYCEQPKNGAILVDSAGS